MWTITRKGETRMTAMKIAIVFFVLAFCGMLVSIVMSMVPADINIAIIAAVLAILLSAFGLYFAFESWKEESGKQSGRKHIK